MPPVVSLAQRLGLRKRLAYSPDSITADSLDLGFEQVEVSPASALSGQKLRETTIRSELHIVIAAIRRGGGEMVFNPSADTTIEAGDLLLAIARAEALAELGAPARGTKAGVTSGA